MCRIVMNSEKKLGKIGLDDEGAVVLNQLFYVY